MSRTKSRENNIALNEIFSVSRILAARGFTVEETADISTTLLRNECATEIDVEAFFVSFDSTEKRKRILDSLLQTGVEYQENRKRYSNTLEWYVGQLLVKKFRSFDSAFGVKVKHTIRPNEANMGDCDVLSVMGDMSLFYAECKSGEVRFDEVEKAVERGLVLATAATVIIYEREQDILELIKGRNYPGIDHTCRVDEVSVARVQDSNILMWHDLFFLDATKGLESKLQTCLRLVAQRKNGYLQVFGADVDYLATRGFKIN